MKLIVFSFCILASLALSSCRTTVDGRHDRVIVEDGYNHGGFCPPGQAKKGNC